MTEILGPVPACGPEDHCITCGDTAVPMRVVEIDLDRELALCDDGEGRRGSVEMALVAPLAPGDFVLVHAGTALVNLGPDGVMTA